jgi:prevent-host-death family protein
MATINVKDARSQLKALLERAEAGEEITIARRGKAIARLVPPARRSTRLPAMAKFRASIRMKGRSLSATVRQIRKDERF